MSAGRGRLTAVTPEEMRARLISAGLDRHADALLELARPSIRLRSTPAPDDGFATGSTKLGGRPDLPRSFEWPRDGNGPLSFVAQVSLEEISPFSADGRLPRSGLLSFFYDSQQSVWGFDPADRGAWSVMFTAIDDPLVRHEFPDHLPAGARYRACTLHPETEMTYGSWESSEVHALSLTEDERFAYAEALGGEDPPVHRLLGHAAPIQGDMQLECQLVSNGLYCGDDTGYNDPRARILQPGAVDWRLLFQVDSDDNAGMMWGDLGRIYYWMRKEDLASGAWDATWLVLQCA
jgi:uncharacterized protein YwqG